MPAPLVALQQYGWQLQADRAVRRSWRDAPDLRPPEDAGHVGIRPEEPDTTIRSCCQSADLCLGWKREQCHRAAGGDAPDLAWLSRKPEIAIWPCDDDAIRRVRRLKGWEALDFASQRDPANVTIVFEKPEIAIRPCGERGNLVRRHSEPGNHHAAGGDAPNEAVRHKPEIAVRCGCKIPHLERKRELRDLAGQSHFRELANALALREPEIAIWPYNEGCGIMALLGKSELPDIAVRAHSHDLGAHPREPEIAVRPCGDEDVRWRHGKLRQRACWRDACNLLALCEPDAAIRSRCHGALTKQRGEFGEAELRHGTGTCRIGRLAAVSRWRRRRLQLKNDPPCQPRHEQHHYGELREKQRKARQPTKQTRQDSRTPG